MSKIVVDSHQHYWNLGLFDYAWIAPDDAVLHHNFEPADFEPVRVANKIDHVVAVQAHQSVAETRWLLELSDRHEFIAGVVGWVDLLDDALDATLANLTMHPRLKGVRHVVQDEPADDWLLQPMVVRNINRLADYDLSYDILIFPRQLPFIPALLEQCPRTRFVVDHLAKPPIASGEIDDWRRGMTEIAKFPEVFVKLSGLVTEADHENWKTADLRPYADAALELFGPQRLMFGSDYPVCLLAADYARVVETCRELLGNASPQDVDQIFGDNARRFYRLDLD